jgi:hypothetical protein
VFIGDEQSCASEIWGCWCRGAAHSCLRFLAALNQKLRPKGRSMSVAISNNCLAEFLVLKRGERICLKAGYGPRFNNQSTKQIRKYEITFYIYL